VCSTSLAVICNGTLIGFNNEGNVTKIEIDFNEGEIESFTPSMIATKVYAAFNEAKENEIKLGDWFQYTSESGFIEIIKCDWDQWKKEDKRIYPSNNTVKLPQELQDGLNEFIGKNTKF